MIFRESYAVPRVVFGAGVFGRLGEELGEAKRVLVITSRGRNALAEDVPRQLGARCVGIVAEAKEHVPRTTVDLALARVREASPDLLLAIGGGSSTGLAKALARAQKIPIACIPTTYAGSEMTPIWGISEGDTKTTGRDLAVLPSLVVYDPELTISLPPKVALASCFNALAHAVAALHAEEISPSLAATAEQAISGLARSIIDLGYEPANVAITTRALHAAFLSGRCLAGAKMGLHHAICHVLGGRFRLPHAETHAVVLPYALAHLRARAERASARVVAALRADDAAVGVWDLGRHAALPSSLAELGLAEGDLDAVVSDVCLRDGAREVGVEAVKALLLAAHAGKRPTTNLPAPVRLEPFAWQSGFASNFECAAVPGALPRRQNMPLPAPLGLYGEQVNGTPFTVRRKDNRRVWMYRVRPSNQHEGYEPVAHDRLVGSFADADPDPSLGRWSPLSIPTKPVDFVDGLATFGGAGEAGSREGFAVHLYAANASMTTRSLKNVDGDLLIVPELGALHCRTELGWLRACPGEILVLPAGLRFAMHLPEGRGRGYVLEVFGRHFELPERGVVGANGLADARHFRAPVPDFEAREHPGFVELVKTGGRLYRGSQEHSPWDVVAWHGNLAPYKYDLSNFNTLGSVSWDHPDPSILTVLSAPIGGGRSVGDLVIFPGRWDVAEHSFRPPFFHRNAATEWNGIVSMHRPVLGYEPGCYFHTPMHTPHGIEASGVRAAYHDPEGHSGRPRRSSDASLWIQFESCFPMRTTRWALDSPDRDREFGKLFQGVGSTFG